MMRISVFCLVVLLMALGAFACGSENAEPKQQPQPTAARMAQDSIPVPTPTAIIVEEGPTKVGSYAFVEEGAATASLEERMYFADVVVRARLVSVIDTGYTFRSIEYLKGTGPAKFSVRADTSNRQSQWDNQDAILFLMPLTGATEDFEFIDTTTIVYGHDGLEYATTTDGHYVYPNGDRIPSHLPNGQRIPSHVVVNGERYRADSIVGVVKVYNGDLSEGHSVASRNPVWLPIEASGTAQRSASGQQTLGDSTVITDYDSSLGTAETISGSAFQDTLSWLSGTTPAAGGNAARSAASPPGEYTAEEVDNCLRGCVRSSN